MKALLLAVLVAVAMTVQAQVPGPDLANAVLQVVDGDTLKIAGRRLRLEAVDTPETFRPRCDNELRKGQEATARLKELMAAANEVWIDDTGEVDKYDRPLIHLMLDGRDAGDILVQEGFALEWLPGRQAWLDRRFHWCGF